MTGNPEDIEYLHSAARSELTAVSRYWLQNRLQEDWGSGRLARKSRAEGSAAMHRADHVIPAIVFPEGHPNLRKIDRLRSVQTVRRALECDLAAESDARTLGKNAREYCRAAGDDVSMPLFEVPLKDEEGHVDVLQTRLGPFDRLGGECHGLMDALPADRTE